MKKFWQTEWHGIQFSDIAPTSSVQLAEASFYDSFYRELFRRYSSYHELDQGWRKNKNSVADWIARSVPKGARVLSVGCGLGYIEQKLWHECSGQIELHVSDYASESLSWLKDVIPSDRIHESLEEIREMRYHSFNFIYISAVDYAMDDESFIGLISYCKHMLAANGQLLIISASFLKKNSTVYSRTIDLVKAFLDMIGLRSRGQFWGWMRTREEYNLLMKKASFDCIKDGFVDHNDSKDYWISGIVGK